MEYRDNFALFNLLRLRNEESAEEAFTDLMQRESTWMVNYVKRRFPSLDPEDVLQRAFMNVWRFRADFEQPEFPGQAYGFLKTVAHNVAINMIEANNARPKQVPFVLEDLVDKFAAPEQTEALAVDELSIKSKLEVLDFSDKHIQMAVDFGIYDYSYETIAAMYGVKKGTVMSGISRGREKIKQTWQILSNDE